MSRREQYMLTFQKWRNPDDGEIVNLCRKAVVDNYSFLQIIEDFSIAEIHSLINNIENAQNGLQYNDLFLAGRVDEDLDVMIAPPNFLIGATCSLPLQHMKELLQEWLDFINR